MKLLKFIFLLTLSGTTLHAQNISLSSEEMLADFDELVEFLNDFAVHKDLNAIRLGIDYDQEFSSIRSEISSQTTPCEFRSILDRTTNLIQDLHCSSMGYDYLSQYGKFQERLNFKSKEKSYEKLKEFEALCNERKPKLTLPLIFSNGAYRCYADFIIQDDTVKKGSVITAYNGLEIAEYINDNPDKVWPIKVDADNNKYHERFYQYGSESFRLTFNMKDTPQVIEFNLMDSIDLITPHQREISYYSQKKAKVIGSKEHRILYIGLPFMDQSISKSLIKKIDSVSIQWKDFEKVVIDMRGNPGGSDLAWREVLEHIVPKPISFDVNLKYLYNERTIDHYGSKKDTKEERIQLLNNARFWSEEKVTITLKPDNNTLNFEGEIYVLQDPYIYSSAGNFSNLCLTNEQLLSIGGRTDLVGGLQKEPLFYQLQNSGLIYRVEPVLDFSNVEDISGFAHNEVEINIQETVEDRFNKTTYEGSIYSKEFLFSEDALMKYVIEQ